MNAFVHISIALIFVLVAATSGRRLESRERRRNYAVVTVFAGLLLLTIPGSLRQSPAGTVLLICTVLVGIGAAILLALGALAADAPRVKLRR